MFSADHIDYATQYFLDHLKIKKTDQCILDLASGNGIIGNEIFNEITLIDSLTADEIIDNQYIGSPFIPEPEADNYTFTYTTTSDEDSGPNDHNASFDIDLVDEMIFRKENGEVTGGLNPYIYDTING